MEKMVIKRLFVLAGLAALFLTVPFGAIYAFGGSYGGYGGDVPVIPPDVNTQSATEITSVSAILRADVNPEELNTVAWFEWGSSGEGLSRVTPDQFIGNGFSFISILAPVNNLTPNTVYIFRAAAENSDGVSYGSTLSFRTLGGDVAQGNLPRVTTRSATNITGSSAALVADIDPEGSATEVWFEWGQNADSLNNQTSRQSVGNGDSTLASLATLSGLSNDTIYYFRALAKNINGTSFGSTLSFRTLQSSDGNVGDGGVCQIPIVSTLTASFVNRDSANLRGFVNPRGRITNAWFEWGRTPALGQETGFQSVGSGNINTEIVRFLSQLDLNTTYYFRVAAENNCGRNRGNVSSFSTEAGTNNILPQAITLPAANVTQVSATMRGQANPNSGSSRAWFEWGTNASLTSFQSTSPLNIGQGNVFTDISANPGLLSPNTIYYYRAAADNSFGTNRGAIVSFTTLPSVSSVVAVSQTPSVTADGRVAKKEVVIEANTASVASYFSGGALLWLLLLSFLIVFLLVYVFYTRYKVNKLLKV